MIFKYDLRTSTWKSRRKYILPTTIRFKLVFIVMRWCRRYTAVVPNICLTIFKMFVCLFKQLKDVSKEALTTFAEMISLNYISLKVGVLQWTDGTSFLRFGFAFLSFAWMRKYIVKFSLCKASWCEKKLPALQPQRIDSWRNENGYQFVVWIAVKW